MRHPVIIGGTSHPALTKGICSVLGIENSQVVLKKFSNGENSVTIIDSVRDKDVYVIQTSCGNVNDNFVELLITLSACKTASARKVTAVMPLFPYSRQPDVPYKKVGAPSEHYLGRTYSGSIDLDVNINNINKNNKNKNSLSNNDDVCITSSNTLYSESNAGHRTWVAQSGNLVANLLVCAGADHIITMDLHDPQFQGFFDIPVDNMYSRPLMIRYINDKSNLDLENTVIVSPDAGGAKRATALADTLQCDFALIHRNLSLLSPSNIDENQSMTIVGDVFQKTALLVDDLVDTANTIIRAARLLKQQHARKVFAIVTHGVFSSNALQKIKNSSIDKIIVTNSIPQDNAKSILGDRIQVIDVSTLFGEAIRRIHNGESLSRLFDSDFL